MNNPYNDIRSLTSAEPVWWDEHAVPRYCAFSPYETANIYAREAVLLLIECQDCGREFQVCMTDSVWSSETLATMIGDATIHYGDPPNVGCCPAGPTMNSVPIRVLEFWRREPVTVTGWFRDADMEVNVTPIWDPNTNCSRCGRPWQDHYRPELLKFKSGPFGTFGLKYGEHTPNVVRRPRTPQGGGVER